MLQCIKVLIYYCKYIWCPGWDKIIYLQIGGFAAATAIEIAKAIWNNISQISDLKKKV